MKRVHSRWVSQLPKNRKGFVDAYRVVMRFIVRNHRWFGVAAAVAVIVHLAVGLASRLVSKTGIVAGALLLALALIGVYGTFVKPGSMKGKLLMTHRTVAFVLLVFVLSHLVFPALIAH
jgi:hypothetical protein